MSTVKANAWEVATDDNRSILLALAGNATLDDTVEDRKRRAQEILTTCAITTNKTGFEIGSGTGLVAAAVAPRCKQLDCYDISASFLELARRTCGDQANVTFNQITDQWLAHAPSDYYDFGYSLNVFIHLNAYDIFNYLLDVQRVLKSGSMFYFDAVTLGSQTEHLFLEHAAMYRQDPTAVRGLLGFNSPDVIKKIIELTKMSLHELSDLSQPGWLKVLVQKS